MLIILPWYVDLILFRNNRFDTLGEEDIQEGDEWVFDEAASEENAVRRRQERERAEHDRRNTERIAAAEQRLDANINSVVGGAVPAAGKRPRQKRLG